MPNKISDQCKNCTDWDCAWCEIYNKHKEGSRQEERNSYSNGKMYAPKGTFQKILDDCEEDES